MKRKAGGGYVDDVRELAKMPVRLHTCWRTKETVAEGKEKEGEPGGACGCSSVPMANRSLRG